MECHLLDCHGRVDKDGWEREGGCILDARGGEEVGRILSERRTIFDPVDKQINTCEQMCS